MSKKLSNVFDNLQSKQTTPKKAFKQEKDSVPKKQENQPSKKNTTKKEIKSSNEKNDVQKPKVVENKVVEEKIEETISEENNNVDLFKQSVLNKYKEKKNKKTVEETHVRTTFLLEKDLAKRLDKLTKGKHGMKQLVLNDAVEAIVTALEE